MNFNFKKIFYFFIVFLAFESLSFLGYLFPVVREIGFFLIAVATIILSLKNLKYGLMLALAELIAGGKGYLFYFEYGGTMVSLRIAIFLAIMAVWVFIASKKLFASRGQILAKLRPLEKSFLPYFMVLLAFCAWGAINGLLRGNGFANVFFDSNGWLFFFLVFPAYQAFKKDQEATSTFPSLFVAGLSAMALKTFFLEFIFSHKIYIILEPVYRWVRTSGVGEITIMDSGFTRVFLQSQIFALFTFFILIVILNELKITRRIFFTKDKQVVGPAFFFFLVLIISIILISFSRSFWLASTIVFALYIIFTFKKKGLKKTLKSLLLISSATAVSLLLITAIIKFPYPHPSDVRFTDALSERASALAGEAAVSSRQELWPKLLEQIKEAPILGKGFGATVTYKTGDPRTLASSADGLCTTYAFEWGWLDTWLKLGFLGAIFYLFLMSMITIQGFKSSSLAFSLSLGLILLGVVNFFTPYTNHPLGIGFLIITAVIIEREKYKC